MNKAEHISLDTIKENLIEDYSKGELMRELAIKYNIGLSSISMAFKRWGIKARSKDRWVKFVRKYSPDDIFNFYEADKYSIKKISSITGYDRTTIKKYLTSKGFTQRSKSEAHRIYKVNESYFENLDTKEKAYWLGFLYADGCNKEEENTIELSLSSTDRAAIESFKQVLQTDAPIKDYTNKRGFNYASFSVFNQKLSQDLAKLGCVQRKTKILKFPNITKKLIPSFLLGYFDGDGSIWTGKTSSMFEVAGTEAFLTDYQNVLMKECYLNKTKLAPRKEIKILRYGGRTQLKRIFNFIYLHEGFKLDRKYSKFKEIIN